MRNIMILRQMKSMIPTTRTLLVMFNGSLKRMQRKVVNKLVQKAQHDPFIVGRYTYNQDINNLYKIIQLL
uniref:Uncharacterized protein n=1 Tax=Papilio xuthus TaxID=66420 RepID=I4DP37_PAPXU|nr:unknown unsecreted protein [Papilio xuthus]